MKRTGRNLISPALIREWICEWLMNRNPLRWMTRVVGVGLVTVWVWLIFWQIDPKDGAIGAACIALPAFASLLLGAIMLAPSLAGCLAYPFFKFIDSIYLGTHDIEIPLLTYDVAERLLRERRWEDAASEYERQAYWHPKESRAWNETIRCYILAGDAMEAERVYRQARLRCPGVNRSGYPDSSAPPPER
jgi:hypothetical protein